MKKLRRQRKDREPKSKFIEIQYTKDPPILEQCGSCLYASVTSFVPPKTCPLQIEVAAMHIACKEYHDCWQEGDCANFKKGTPEIQNTLTIIQN